MLKLKDRRSMEMIQSNRLRQGCKRLIVKRIGSFISLWSVVFLLVAIVGIQMAAIEDFFSDINHHGTHIESTDSGDTSAEEAKHLSFHLDFHFSPVFQVPPVTFSHGHLVCQNSPLSTFVFLSRCSSRAPPA
jgi:hypothetical protein